MPNMALRNAVRERLDRADQLADRGTAETSLPIEREEVHRLTRKPSEPCCGGTSPRRTAAAPPARGRTTGRVAWLVVSRKLPGDRSRHARHSAPEEQAEAGEREAAEHGVFEWPPELPDSGGPPATLEEPTAELPAVLPPRAQLETDHTRLHRVQVVARPSGGLT